MEKPDIYLDAVGAVVDIAASISGATWQERVCGTWTATDLARHLVVVVGWYDAWLTRAVNGDAKPPFAETQLDVENARALGRAPEISGEAAIAQFHAAATAYLQRTSQYMNLAYGYPSGTVTVALHLGVAAAEWHLHAWDLSALAPARHAPRDPGALYVAAASCVAATKRPLQRRALRGFIPIGSRVSPWRAMLRASGR